MHVTGKVLLNKSLKLFGPKVPIGHTNEHMICHITQNLYMIYLYLGGVRHRAENAYSVDGKFWAHQHPYSVFIIFNLFFFPIVSLIVDVSTLGHGLLGNCLPE